MAYMLQDASVELVITQNALADRLPLDGQVCLRLDCPQVRAMLEGYRSENPSVEELGLTPQHLSYVIYTSGSTGQPKGVLVEHATVCHFHGVLAEQFRALDLDPKRGAWLWSASYAFDASVKGLLAMCSGRRIVMATTTQRKSADDIASLLLAHCIDVFNGMPQLVEHVLASWRQRTDKAINLMLSGDQVPPELWTTVVEYCREQGCKALNAYGPTELTINASYTLIEGGHAPHIGRPVSNCQAYVLDNRQRLLPAGACGELCVSGSGVARGYMNQPALQEEKFVTVTVADGGGQRMYRTGDRVRWRADGTLEFLGRIDRQVKVHGFRIELGDIEAQIQSLPEVRQTHVLVRTSESGEKQLTAFCVTEPGTMDGRAGEDDILGRVKQAVAERLPEYMLPALWIELDSMPRTTAGKIDRGALLHAAAELNKSHGVEAPASAVEEALCAIWRDTLEVEEVGVRDNFFALGGFSLLAIKLLNLIRERLGAELDLQDLFEHPDVSSLATLIAPPASRTAADADNDRDSLCRPDREHDKAQGDPLSAIGRADRSQRLPLSHAQQRLWFIDQLEGGSGQYNMPMTYRLRGEFDWQAFEWALAGVIERHEVLRTNFVEQDGKTFQFIRDSIELPVSYQDLSGLDPNARQREAEALIAADTCGPFDLSNEPLLRTQVITLDERTRLL
ncbi:MAG: AMP-binding protein, partial [Wenzhouxiangellaceae bacterium]